MSGFASVILDVDSTISGIEGVDWLAERRGADVATQVSGLTDLAMRGEIPLDAVYGERMGLVRPSSAEIEALSIAYIAALAPGARDAIATLRDHGRRVVLVSGGLREAILPLAEHLGIAEADVHAVGVHFTDDGSYEAFDTTSHLATATGKRAVAESLALPPRVLAVGDGSTDLAMRPAVDAFAAYAGFVRRAPVCERADLIIESFDQLVEIVLA